MNVFMPETKKDVIIIGGGPGGYSAALYCARAGLSTLVLEMLSAGGQMATTGQVDNYPGFGDGIDGLDLAEKMQKGAERFGAVSEFAEVTSLELKSDPKVIRTAGGDYTASAIIIATGALPRELGLPGETELRGRGLSYCATCDGNFFKHMTVAIVGGGDSAAGDALSLSKLCDKVYLIHRRDTLRASRSYVEPLEKAENIVFVWDSQVDKLLWDKKGFTGLVLTNKKNYRTWELYCDALFVAVGRVPNTSLLEGQLELDDGGYIISDETTRTSIPGVFAVGDVRTKPLRQIVTAAADGAVASKYAEEYLAGV